MTAVTPTLTSPRIAPLSAAQRRFWFLHEWDTSKALSSVPFAVRLVGTLDVAALESGIAQLVHRHEALRTSFHLHGEEPVQRVATAAPGVFQYFDFNTQADPESRAREWLRVEVRRPFDLTDLPLIRVGLLRLAEGEHVLSIVAHHIIVDGWSFAVLMRELAVLYDAMGNKNPPALEQLPICYTDYCAREREWLNGEARHRQMTYWTAQLAGLESLDLPADRSRPVAPTYEASATPIALSAATTNALRDIARRERLTMPMMLTAAFQILLGRYCGQEDVAVGVAVANRNHVDTEGLIGLFVNTLVLRLDLSGQPTVKDLLQRARQMSLDAYRNTDLPFDELVAAVVRERTSGQQSLIRAMVLVRRPLDVRFSGLTVETLPVWTKSALFDLAVEWADNGGELTGTIRYSTELFDSWRVEQIARHYERLLEILSSGGEQDVASLNLLDPSERRQMLEAWNPPAADVTRASIVELFERQAAKTPEAPAVVFGDTTLTYAALNQRSNQLARHLLDRGARSERVVGVALSRSIESIVALLGIFKSRAIYLPIDPDLPNRRLAVIVEDARPEVILTSTDIAPLLPSAPALIPLDAAATLEILSRYGGGDLTETDGGAYSPADGAYVMYTSGSTGTPKGVVVEHSALAAFVDAVKAHVKIGPGEQHLAVTTMSFDISILEMLLPLCQGAAVIMAERQDVHDVALMASLIRKHRPTSLQATPTYWGLLIQHDAACVRGLRMLVGGEALPADLCRELLSHGESVCNLYGPTEATVWASVLQLTERDAASPSGSTIAIGRPLSGYQMYVLDRRLNIVPVGVPGELYISGAGLARGYLNRPGLTAERFVANPYGSAGSRMYRTGDRARWRPDGVLEYLGRADDQIKIRGLRVELREIEATLRGHDRVSDAVVIARGEGHEKHLFAYVVPLSQGLEPSLETELQRHLKQHLPSYMIPARITALPAWPMTPSGKLDRRALPTTSSAAVDYRAPQTPREEIICAICQEVLRVPMVGLDDSFFALGGHSLMAMRVIARIHEVMHISVPVHLFFDQPTIGSLAAWVEARSRDTSDQDSDIQPLSRDSDLPLSFNQERHLARVWWAAVRSAPLAPFSVSVIVPFIGKVDAFALERTLNEIARRHESLRTGFVTTRKLTVIVRLIVRLLRFRLVQKALSARALLRPGHSSGSVWSRLFRQDIEAQVSVPLRTLDLSGLNETAQQETWQSLPEVRSPFDLETPPLMRAVLATTGPDRHELLLVVSHIVADWWSGRLLRREIEVLYDSFSKGQPSPLPELSIQYADFAGWERRRLSADRLERYTSYWQGQLPEFSPFRSPLNVTDLPFHRRLDPPARQWRRETLIVGGETFAGIQQLCGLHGVTLYMFLYAAVSLLLHTWSGRDRVTVWAPFANRTAPGVQHLIGWFEQTQLLVLDVGGNPTFVELLRRSREVVLGAMAHQMPFALFALRQSFKVAKGESFPTGHISFDLRADSLPDDPEAGRAAPAALTAPLDHLSTISLAIGGVQARDNVRFTIRYSTDWFTDEVVSDMLTALRTSLERIVAAPSTPVSDLI